MNLLLETPLALLPLLLLLNPGSLQVPQLLVLLLQRLQKLLLPPGVDLVNLLLELTIRVAQLPLVALVLRGQVRDPETLEIFQFVLVSKTDFLGERKKNES